MDDALMALAPRLHQFVAVARAEHMTHAADEIGVDTPTLRGLVGAGLGVALLPVAGPVPGVVEIPLTAPRTRRTIGVVWARDRRLTAPARALLAFVRGRELLRPA